MDEMFSIENYFWQGKKVKLRPLCQSDWEFKYQEMLDTETRRFLEWRVELPVSEEEYKKSIADISDFKGASETGVLLFGIETLSNEFVGWINMHSRDEKNGTFSFSLSIFSPFRKKRLCRRSRTHLTQVWFL